MNKEEIYRGLAKIVDQEDLFLDEPMHLHTSFKIGGPADIFVVPHKLEQIISVVQFCLDSNVPYYVIGNGSNLLVTDKGYRGVILQIYKNLNLIRIEGDRVYAEAGVLLSKLSKDIYDKSLEGFEFASGIPGTLGGAIVMNAGAYGGEMKDILEEVTAMNQKGELIVIPKKDLELGYRSSILQRKEYIAINATLLLRKGNQAEIKAKLSELAKKRKEKQPLEMPSAGSAFKRPTGHFAGKLIMDAGLRGFSIGDAQVSEKHCGFIVNKGQATAEDVIELMKEIKRTVKERFGVELEPEIKLLGER